MLIGAIGGYFYWQSVKKTPQYSLALLVDAARRDDKNQVAQIIDTEQVVNNFVPQISEKAVELYGRNLPPSIINRVALLVAPLMPAIKEKAKEELPQLIREKTEKLDRAPYWAIALFAERGLDIKIEGDTATIKSKIPENPAEFTMKRDGNLWKITAIKDEKLAQKVAEKVGQQILALAKKGNILDAGKQLGIENTGEILKGLNDIFK
ncbi:MAG: hypothetical protein HC846_13755 [Blastocatellia bacterium]|nr:hypothetical protein [Blastocatellia bacterium]